MKLAHSTWSIALLLLVFCFFRAGEAAGQRRPFKKNGGTAWSEPLFKDNAGSFEAAGSSLEFCYLPIFHLPGDGTSMGHGWEMQTSLSRKLSLETGFYSAGYRSSDLAFSAGQTHVQFAAQYLFRSTATSVSAIGLEVRPPTWTRNGGGQESTFLAEHFLTLARKHGSGWSSQHRFAAEAEWGKGGAGIRLAPQSAVFWQRQKMQAGAEAGGVWGEQVAFVFLAPQAGVQVGSFFLGAGLKVSVSFLKQHQPDAFALCRLAYRWERQW